MALDAPQISLRKDFARPQKGGQVELQLSCQVKTPTSDFSNLRVKVVHHDGQKETILYGGPLNLEGKVTVSALLDESAATRGHIFAVLEGVDVRGAAHHPLVEPSGTDRDGWSSLDAFGEKSSSVPSPLIPTPSAPRSRRRIHEPQKVQPKEIRRRPKSQPQGPDIPPRSFLKNRIAKYAAYLMGMAALSTAAAGAVVRQEYLQGVEDAKEVAHDARVISMVPVQIQNQDGSFSSISSLSSASFVSEDIKRWNSNSEAYNLNDNPNDPQSEHIGWTIKPVSVVDVQAGGPLYLTRKALTFGEDNQAETGTGINLKGFIRSILSLGGGGGSTLADQICGDIWEQTGKFKSLAQLKKSSVFGRFSPARFQRKEREVFCAVGLGLGEQMSVDEMFAAYMTYQHLGNGAEGVRNFASRYWGIEDLNDPRFTRGHKIILAALPAHPVPQIGSKGKDLATRKKIIDDAWDHLNEKNHHEGILPRALGLLDGLVENGTIPASEKEAIVQEIRAAEPSLELYEKSGKTKNTDYAFVNTLARKELNAHLKASNQTFSDWRDASDGLLVSLEPNLQSKLPSIVQKEVQRFPLKGSEAFSPGVVATGTVFVVNGNGEYIGVFTGTKDGYLAQETLAPLTEVDNPGSVGKLFVGAQLGALGLFPVLDSDEKEDEKVKRAANDLRRSVEDLAPAAEDLGINSANVKQLIECYGNWRNVSVSPTMAAVTGNWDVVPKNIPAYLYAMMTGKLLPDPHLVVGEISGHASTPWVAPSSIGNAHCADLMYANGIAKEWGALPFKGTMKGMDMPSSVDFAVGKTGTAERIGADGNALADRSTNIVWAPFAVQMKDGEQYMAVTYIRPILWTPKKDKKTGESMVVPTKDLYTNMGYKLWAADAAVPVSNQVLQILGQIPKK